jgi:Tfp pilus assembly protein PilF
LNSPRTAIIGNSLLLLVSLTLLVLSVRWTAASVFVGRGLSVIEESGTPWADTQSAADALTLFSRATELNPLAADAWLFRAKTLSGLDSKDLSSPLFAHALQLRPQSASLWVEYAEHSLKQGAPASDTLARLNNALAFAPYKPSVRKAELRISFALWSDLNQAQRERLFASVGYMLQHDRNFVIDTAIASGWANELRPL